MTLSRVLPYAALLLVLLTIAPAQADDLKDISQLANQGQQAAALNRINTYLSTNPNDVQAMFIKGVILAEQNRRDEAIKVFTELTEKYPNLPEPYNNLAVLYADQGQYDKARKALETAIRTHPSYATAHENLGDIYARMASEAYDKALQLDNGNTRTQNKLSLIKDLFSTSGKPVQLASRAPVARPATKEPAKETAKTETLTPVLPIRPAEPAKAPEPKPVVTSKVAEPEKTVAAAKPAAKETPPANNVNKDASKEITAAVQGWAKAWSSKKVDRYLASYADNFQTPDGLSRKDWEQLRRERITKPSSIQVEVSRINIRMKDNDEARVSFRQGYRAGKTTMRTAKTLVMKKAGDSWLIRQELAGD